MTKKLFLIAALPILFAACTNPWMANLVDPIIQEKYDGPAFYVKNIEEWTNVLEVEIPAFYNNEGARKFYIIITGSFTTISGFQTPTFNVDGGYPLPGIDVTIIGNNHKITLPNTNDVGSLLYIGDEQRVTIKDLQLNRASITNHDLTNNIALVSVSGTDARFTMTGSSILSGNKNNQYGGGVYVDSEGVFTMSGGSITDNKGFGGGVYVASGGTFYMSGGATISGNDGDGGLGGGVYVDGGGTFTMTGGNISGNENTSEGGGVFVDSDNTTRGVFTMTGGNIYNNTANNGGGVFVDGDFSMSGNAKIFGNNAVAGGMASGGGVCVYNGGFFTMSGSRAEIYGNTSAKDGGGVFVYGGKFLMQNGIISGNTAEQDGGGVYVTNDTSYIAVFTMTGGTITGDGSSNTNIATTGSGNALFVQNGTVTIPPGSTTVLPNQFRDTTIP